MEHIILPWYRLLSKQLDKIQHYETCRELKKIPTVKPFDSEIRFIEYCFKRVIYNKILYADTVKKYRAFYHKYTNYFNFRKWPDDIRNATCQRYIREMSL